MHIMKEVYVGDLYQELLVGLNGLIEKTVEIQKATLFNSPDYRDALRFQIELEKNKLQIMDVLREGLETKITNKVLVGHDELGREVFKIKECGDARFVGTLTTTDVKSNDNKNKEVEHDDDPVSSFIDGLFKEVRKIIDEQLNEIDNKNKCHIDITVKDYNHSASNFATVIMNAIKKSKGAKF